MSVHAKCLDEQSHTLLTIHLLYYSEVDCQTEHLASVIFSAQLTSMQNCRSNPELLNSAKKLAFEI